MYFWQKLFWLVATSAMLSGAWAQAVDPFVEAATLGKSKGMEIYNTVTTQPASSSTVPGFTGANQSQQGYFQGGKGDLVGPGVGRASGCNTQTDPECNAVNLIQWGPNNRPRPTFNAADSLISTTKARQANPGPIVGSFATPAGSIVGALSQTSKVCKPVVTPKPAVYADQICNESVQLADSVCTSDRQFALDPLTTYRCLNVNLALTANTCSQTQEVVIDAKQTYECLNSIASESVQHCGEARQVEVAWNYPYQCVDDRGSQTVDNCNVDRFVQLDPKTVYQCLEQQKLQSSSTGTLSQIVTVKADYDFDCVKASQISNNYSCLKTQDPTVTWSYRLGSECKPGQPVILEDVNLKRFQYFCDIQEGMPTALRTSNLNASTGIWSVYTIGLPVQITDCFSNTNGYTAAQLNTFTPNPTKCWDTVAGPPLRTVARLVCNDGNYCSVTTYANCGGRTCTQGRVENAAFFSNVAEPTVVERTINNCASLESKL
jgi:hypothetical protein